MASEAADLPVQELVHIQHTCETLSETHTAAHHRCWRMIHGELARLASPKWKLMCISGEKNLETTWTELTELTEAGQRRESVAQTRLWRMRPDGLAFRLPTKTKAGTLCILEFKRI